MKYDKENEQKNTLIVVLIAASSVCSILVFFRVLYFDYTGFLSETVCTLEIENRGDKITYIVNNESIAESDDMFADAIAKLERCAPDSVLLISDHTKQNNVIKDHCFLKGMNKLWHSVNFMGAYLTPENLVVKEISKMNFFRIVPNRENTQEYAAKYFINEEFLGEGYDGVREATRFIKNRNLDSIIIAYPYIFPTDSGPPESYLYLRSRNHESEIKFWSVIKKKNIKFIELRSISLGF